jgi:uncharacterized protein YjbJ (UPF0337 family)
MTNPLPNSDQVSGRIKQAAGDLTSDQDLKAEGQTQESAGNLKEKVEHVIDSVKDKFTRKT